MKKIPYIEADFSTSVEFQLSEGRYISSKERKEMPAEDYVDSKRKSFPIKKLADVQAAVHSWSRYKGSMSFEEFKSRLTRIAKRKGFESALPKEWKEGKK